MDMTLEAAQPEEGNLPCPPLRVEFNCMCDLVHLLVLQLVAFGLSGIELAAPYTSNGASLIERRQALNGLFNGDNTAMAVTNGIVSGSTDDLLSHAQGLGSAENGDDNQNPGPPKSVYPKAASCDLPVILFPGTSFQGSFISLLTGVDWADPVWVNVPELLLGDAQVNAVYAAYALNYIASLSKRSVAIIGWSQGNIDARWAFKYWPSTRKVTTDHVAISADCKGTALANFVGLSGIRNTPSVVQQEAGSDFIKTLWSDGGDSGYVPTTSLYSSFLDEIVQPQQGAGASAYLLDERNVGVKNAEVQKVCAVKPGASLWPKTRSLITVPKDLQAGLGLEDLLITQNAIVIAGISLVTYLPKVKQEPVIEEYGLKAAGTC
ncbi:lipase B [Fusarium mexicanum]|uniref:Lipase B n=1 Tax=Fusarium mexicanum TaxID=751941 RepID=A0A8H5IBQ5_9HYPO|nr:lipase B [Fusarium mexicanum]